MYEGYWCRPKWGSFSTYNGDGRENVTQRVNSRCFGFFALIPSPNTCQMFANFSEVEFLRLPSKLRKRKNKSFSCVHVLHKTWIWEVSRSSHATTAKKWTKNVLHVQSKLLFCHSRCRRRCCSNRELKQQQQRRLRKRHFKCELALPQTLSRLLHDDMYETRNTFDYDVHRSKFGVCDKGVDEIPPGNAMPLEYNVGYLNGVSFHKGCY